MCGCVVGQWGVRPICLGWQAPGRIPHCPLEDGITLGDRCIELDARDFMSFATVCRVAASLSVVVRDAESLCAMLCSILIPGKISALLVQDATGGRFVVVPLGARELDSLAELWLLLPPLRILRLLSGYFALCAWFTFSFQKSCIRRSTILFAYQSLFLA